MNCGHSTLPPLRSFHQLGALPLPPPATCFTVCCWLPGHATPRLPVCCAWQPLPAYYMQDGRKLQQPFTPHHPTATDGSYAHPTRQHDPIRLLAPRNNGLQRLADRKWKQALHVDRRKYEKEMHGGLDHTVARDPQHRAAPRANAAHPSCQATPMVPATQDHRGRMTGRSKGLEATIPARVTSSAFMQNTW